MRGRADAHDTAYPRVDVKQLRRKLDAEPDRPRVIVTEPGVGYRLRSPGVWTPLPTSGVPAGSRDAVRVRMIGPLTA